VHVVDGWYTVVTGSEIVFYCWPADCYELCENFVILS